MPDTDFSPIWFRKMGPANGLSQPTQQINKSIHWPLRAFWRIISRIISRNTCVCPFINIPSWCTLFNFPSFQTWIGILSRTSVSSVALHRHQDIFMSLRYHHILLASEWHQQWSLWHFHLSHWLLLLIRTWLQMGLVIPEVADGGMLSPRVQPHGVL